MTDSTTIRIPLFAAALLLFAAPRATPSLPQLKFHGVFSGVAADGERCVWQGRVDGPVTGRVTIALRQVEEPAAAANPVWHVASRWTVSDDGAARSFAANLEGMIDWRAGTMRLAGPITEGWSRGSWAEVTGRFVQGVVTGSVTVSPPRSRE
jgi:hypothetical protein